MMGEVELPSLEEIEEQKNDHFSRRVALVTAIYAVLLAITSLGGNNAAKEMMLSQQQSSNQWAYYQSKVMREHMYRSQKLQVEALLLERGKGMDGAARANYEKLAKQMADEEKRYNGEKKEIESAAKKLEQIRDISMAKDPYFDYAEVLLQIAIVLASISILAGSLPVFWISLASAACGAFLMLDGYLLFWQLPFFH